MATARPAPAVASKVFVTRASGIIGTALCGRRRELGAQVADQSNGIVSGDICVPGRGSTRWSAANAENRARAEGLI